MGKGGGAVTDGLLPIDMSRKQLLTHVIRLQAEMDREREDRNYFMLEKERLYQRWNLYMEQIAIEKAKVQALKSHIADSAEEKRKADDLYEQKLRFLKAEQSRKLGQMRLIYLTKIAQAQDDAWTLHMIMKEELMNKKKEIRRAQMAFYQVIRGLHWGHAQSISDLRSEFAREIRRLEINFDRGLFETTERLEQEADNALRHMANSKEDQIATLIDDHAWQADQMKAFFQELLKVSLDIVQQMKIEVKTQTTAELMQRRDYEHFKHRYDTYIGPALRWSTLMDEWVILHQEDNLHELTAKLNMKEDELKKRKYNLRTLEAANEALNQRIIIAEKERNCIKKQFCRSIADSQKTCSMKRLCCQLKRKAARETSEVYLALNKLVHERGTGPNHFKTITDQKDEDAMDLMLDINQQCREHLDIQYKYADAFEDNEIHLDDIGFPIQQVGVKAVAQGDMENLLEVNQGWKVSPDDEANQEIWWEEESVSDKPMRGGLKEKYNQKQKPGENLKDIPVEGQMDQPVQVGEMEGGEEEMGGYDELLIGGEYEEGIEESGGETDTEEGYYMEEMGEQTGTEETEQLESEQVPMEGEVPTQPPSTAEGEE